MPESETSFEGKIGTFVTAPKLTEEAKHRVCELYAQFHTPTQIQRILKDEFSVHITTGSLCIYPRQKKWKPLIDRLRQEWALGLMDLPLAHKRGRMEELVRLYKQVQRAETLSEFSRITQSLALLREMREEMDEAKSHFTAIFATQIHNYSDEELVTRRRELLQRLEELRGPGARVVDAATVEESNGTVSLQGTTTGHDAPQPSPTGGQSNASGDGARSAPESHQEST